MSIDAANTNGSTHNGEGKRTALVTGASSGIGATYAERLARRGHDLVLVARDKGRLDTLAERLRRDFGTKVDVIQADLTVAADLHKVEARLRDDASIGLLVNNAGAALAGGFADAKTDDIDKLIQLNVTSVARLSSAVVPRFIAEGGGDIVNIASVLAFAPEIAMGVYAATKAFVLTLSQSMDVELGDKGVYVQAVLPAATRTEIWERSGRDVAGMTGVMEVGEMVGAALVGYDRREKVTIPPLHDEGQWTAYAQSRVAMLPNLRQEHPAPRYLS